MATINLGNLTFTHKGDYAGGTAYVKNDVVYYATNGNSYIAKTSTTGNAPTSTAHWDLFVAGASGIFSGGLSLGSANQVVAVNSSANALEFQDASGGAWEKLGQVVHTGSSVSAVDVDFTPNDSVYAWYKLYITNLAGSGNGNPYLRVKTGGSTNTSSMYGTGGYGTANNGSGQLESTRRDDTGDNRMHLDQTWTAYTDTDRRLFYEINFYKGSSSANKAFFWQHIVNHDSAYYIGTGIMGGTANTSSALTGFTITLNTGSITDVNAYVLGFKP